MGKESTTASGIDFMSTSGWPSTMTQAASGSSLAYKTTHETLYGAILVLSLVGNLAMLAVLATKSRLKSPANILLLNMVVAELAVAVISIPFDIVGIEKEGEWLYGKAMCKILYPLQTLPYGALVLSITAMSYYRYRGIVFPLKQNLGRLSVNIIITFTWIVSLAIVIPYSVYLEFASGIGCSETWSALAGKYYTVILFVTHYAVPLCIIGYCYIKIAITLCSTRFKNRSLAASGRGMKRRQARSIRAARMVVLFVIVFTVCMFPHHVVWLYLSFDESATSNVYLLTFAYLFTFTSTFANPLIYFTHNPNFRKELWHFLCRCSYERAPNESCSMSVELRARDQRVMVGELTERKC